MSSIGGGHAVHSSGGVREHTGANSGKPIQHSKPQQHLMSNGGNLHANHIGHMHSIIHQNEIDPHTRVAMSGGSHHQQPQLPPPKIEGLGMMDPWSRMTQPPQVHQTTQYPHATHPQPHSSLDQPFINQSPATYYHAPISPYGTPYGAMGNEATHGGAGWSNGGDVASFFGYPAPTAENHHSDSMSLGRIFGNGYPAGAYGAAGSFGFSPHPYTASTHTAPGGPTQDFSSWSGPAASNAAPHDMLDCSLQHHQQQKAVYSDYYRYEMLGGAPTNQMRQQIAGIPVINGGSVPTNGDKLKNLEGQMASLSVLNHGLPHPPRLDNTCHTPILSNLLGTHHEQLRDTNSVEGITEATDNRIPTVENQDVSTNGSSNAVLNSNGHDKNGEPESSISVPNSDEANNNETPTKVDSKSWKGDKSSEAMNSNSLNKELTQETDTAKVDKDKNETQKPQTKTSLNISAWDWNEDEVKDWSASPPPEEREIIHPSLEEGETSISNESIQDEKKHPLLEDLIRKNNYNPETLAVDVINAKFFVIKSYSEDDVHRSIKYSIWCSTERGNAKLDQAYRDQQATTAGPIYLFYSVNGSGHFCGMCQMTSAVDYHTSTGVWAQDKWKGQFKVKWIYVKDVPNSELRHIRLQNNEDKPVTNSRDTQEIPYEKGKQVLERMHNFRHKTTLFDDFIYYEEMEEASVNEKDHQNQGRRRFYGSSDQSSSSRSGSRSGGASLNGGGDRDYRPRRRDDLSPHFNGHHREQRDNRDFQNRPHFRDVRDGSGGFSGYGGNTGNGQRQYGTNRNDNRAGGGFPQNRDRNPDQASFNNFRRNNNSSLNRNRDSDQCDQKIQRDRNDRRFYDQGDRNHRRF